MDITTIISTEFEEFTPKTPVSKLNGAFDDPSVRGVVVRDGETFEGIITRRQLTTSHHQPDETLISIVWHVPKVKVDEDIREVARLMIDSRSRLLPVFDGEQMKGVVTADDLLREVQPFLDAVTVEDVFSNDLVSVSPETTFGKAFHLLREHRITHLPVIEDESAVGMLSLYDVVGLATRSMQRSQGGDSGGTDPFGGDISSSTARARRGGFGAREGEIARILDLPVRDIMISPPLTIDRNVTLDTAIETMFDSEVSSLVVIDEDRPEGIVTKTDIIDSLTWEAEGNRAIQVYGTRLLDDLSYDDVIDIVDGFERLDGSLNILDAKIHLHEHDEKLRGTPLLLARIRLYTDRGMFVASSEGYGASHALKEARDRLERRIRDDKTYAQTKKPPDETYWKKRFGWRLKE